MKLTDMIARREFLKGAAAFAAMPPFAALAGGMSSGVLDASVSFNRSEKCRDELIDSWNAATGLVKPKDYFSYMRDGDTRGLKALAALEHSFDKVMREAKETVVKGDAPAVWSVYNMGYVVKTRESLFSIDLVHRRAPELAKMLDFALITHNHNDHWRQEFYRVMDGAGKTVVSNFLDNYGVKNWRRDGGYTRAKRAFKIGRAHV